MREYILSVVIAAGISAMASSLMNQKTAIGQLVRLLGGLLVVITVIVPLGRITFDGASAYFRGLSTDAETYVSSGRDMAQESIDGIIKSQAEAYILDKADNMGLELMVEVELDDSNHSIPGSVTVTGALSPYARQTLSAYIADGLGIPKENQRWM